MLEKRPRLDTTIMVNLSPREGCIVSPHMGTTRNTPSTTDTGQLEGAPWGKKWDLPLIFINIYGVLLPTPPLPTPRCFCARTVEPLSTETGYHRLLRIWRPRACRKLWPCPLTERPLSETSILDTNFRYRRRKYG